MRIVWYMASKGMGFRKWCTKRIGDGEWLKKPMVKPKMEGKGAWDFCAKCIKNDKFEKKCLKQLTFDFGVCNN